MFAFPINKVQRSDRSVKAHPYQLMKWLSRVNYKSIGKEHAQDLNPFSANFIKWSNTLKQFVGKLVLKIFIYRPPLMSGFKNSHPKTPRRLLEKDSQWTIKSERSQAVGLKIDLIGLHQKTSSRKPQTCLWSSLTQKCVISFSSFRHFFARNFKSRCTCKDFFRICNNVLP